MNCFGIVRKNCSDICQKDSGWNVKTALIVSRETIRGKSSFFWQLQIFKTVFGSRATYGRLHFTTTSALLSKVPLTCPVRPFEVISFLNMLKLFLSELCKSLSDFRRNNIEKVVETAFYIFRGSFWGFFLEHLDW